MKLIYLFLLFLCLGTVHGVAQTFKVQGQVVSAELQSLPDVRLSLTMQNDSTVIATALTDSQGRFVISGNPKGPVTLWFRHVAYQTRIYKFPMECDITKVIILPYNVRNIGEVVVTGQAPTLWYNNEGNIAVNMQKIPNHESDNAGDALKKIPGVMVDPNLGILLFGNNARILVDGMDLKVDVETYLNSMPAAMLAEAELIADATGRYGEGGAVINFTTKRRQYSGHFSNVRIAGSYDRMSEKMGSEASYFTMIKKKNFYFNTSLKFESYPYEAEKRQNIYNTVTDRTRIFSSFASERSYKPNNNTNLSWDLAKGRQLAINTFVYYGTEDRKENETQEYMSNPQSNRYSHYKDDPTGLTLSGNIKYQTSTKVLHKFIASYGYVQNRLESGQKDVTLNSNDIVVLDRKNDYKSLSQSHSLKADWWHTIPKTRLTVYGGTKIDLSMLSEENSYDVKISNDTYEESNFDANELIASAYAEAYYNINKKSNVRIGVRGAFTDYNIKNRSQNVDASQNFWNVLPWLTYNYTIKKDWRTTLNFNSGINRPSYSSLMPGIVFYNNYEYQKGNPNLKPSKYYNLSLRNALFDNIFVTVRGTMGYDRIMSTVKEEVGGITQYSYDNAVDYKQINTNLSTSRRFFKDKMMIQFNFNYTGGQYLHPKDGLQIPSGRGNYHNTNADIYINYDFSNRFSVWGRGNYMIDAKSLYNDDKSYAYMDMGLSHRFLKNRKLNISFTANDVFNSRKFDYTRYYGDVIRKTRLSRSNSMFMLSAVFYFSGGNKFNREAGEDPNDTSRFE